MEDKVCLSCGINVPQKPGKKERLYCSSICRQRDWYKKRKKALERLTGKGGVPLPADYVNFKKIGILKKDGTVAELNTPFPGSFTLKNFQELAQVWDKSTQFPAKPIEEALLSPKAAPKAKKPPDVPKKEEKAVDSPKNDPQRHSLWKQGDPKENSGAFFLKYDCNNYEELSKLKK